MNKFRMTLKAKASRRFRQEFPHISAAKDKRRAAECRRWNAWVASQKDVDLAQESAAEWLERNRHLL